MRLVAALAGVGFGGELILHVGSFVGRDPRDWIQPDWVLPGVSLGLLIFVAALGNLANARGRRGTVRGGVAYPDRGPTWFRAIVGIFIAYAIINAFVAFFVDSRPGDPVRRADGAYFAEPGHGRAAVPISADEYHRVRRLQVRYATAVFMAFFLGIAGDQLFTRTGRKHVKLPGQRMIAFVVRTSRRG